MKYPFILQKSKRNYAAVAAQFGILVTSANKAELEQKMADALAEYIFELKLNEHKIPKPIKHHDIDTSDFSEEWFEIVDIEPTLTNPRSLDIARLIKGSGLTQSEIAKRMGTTQSAVSRLADPFYWNHSLSSLERLAKAVGQTLEIKFSRAA